MHLDESFSIENCIRRALSIRVVMTHILSPCATQGCNWSNPVTERKPRDGRGARALRPQLGRLVAKQLGRLVAKPVTRTTRPALPAASVVRGTRRQGRRAVHHGGCRTQPQPVYSHRGGGLRWSRSPLAWSSTSAQRLKDATVRTNRFK